MNFDFVEHKLEIVTGWNEPMNDPALHAKRRRILSRVHAGAGLAGDLVKIWTMPQEIPNPIRFDMDVTHARYDPDYANRFWRIW